MTIEGKPLHELEHAPAELGADLPAAGHHFAPGNATAAAAILAAATDERATVLFHGAGTRQGMGNPVHPDVVLSTARMNRIVDWEPEDLTLVAEPGVLVSDIEAKLAERRQTAGLPEWSNAGTLGGVVATGASGYRRARFGPTRDRMLEVTVVTGDGRTVRGGGRVVKNVSGYDLPRLVTGSMGRLGLISSMCLKLWPLPEMAATVSVTSPSAAWRALYRPLAVLETENGSWAFLSGTPAEVGSQASLLEGEVRDELLWPDPPPGEFACTMRVSPSDVRSVVERLGGWRFVAQHGVGVVDAACDDPDPGTVEGLRAWVEQRGGSLVVSKMGPLALDPWGRPPPAVELQRRVVAGFDPYGIANPGRLPGGI